MRGLGALSVRGHEMVATAAQAPGRRRIAQACPVRQLDRFARILRDIIRRRHLRVVQTLG